MTPVLFFAFGRATCELKARRLRVKSENKANSLSLIDGLRKRRTRRFRSVWKRAAKADYHQGYGHRCEATRNLHVDEPERVHRHQLGEEDVQRGEIWASVGAKEAA